MKNLKQKLGQALLIVLANVGMSAMMVFGFMQNTIY